jgi:hypothetical protein
LAIISNYLIFFNNKKKFPKRNGKFFFKEKIL